MGKNTVNHEEKDTVKGTILEQKQPKSGAQSEHEQQKHEQKPWRVKTSGNEEKIKELIETLQRLQAEFENYQKRSEKQTEEFKSFANAKLILELLPVLDSMEHGMKHNEELTHLHEQLFAILKKKGLEVIPVEQGQKFDHDTMECMLSEKNSAVGEDAVASILVTGYTLNGKILRPAKVSVNVLEKSKMPETEQEKMGDKERKEANDIKEKDEKK